MSTHPHRWVDDGQRDTGPLSWLEEVDRFGEDDERHDQANDDADRRFDEHGRSHTDRLTDAAARRAHLAGRMSTNELLWRLHCKREVAWCDLQRVLDEAQRCDVRALPVPYVTAPDAGTSEAA